MGCLLTVGGGQAGQSPHHHEVRQTAGLQLRQQRRHDGRREASSDGDQDATRRVLPRCHHLLHRDTHCHPDCHPDSVKNLQLVSKCTANRRNIFMLRSCCDTPWYHWYNSQVTVANVVSKHSKIWGRFQEIDSLADSLVGEFNTT